MADETTHTCIQVEKIATLTARLDAQSDADNRIEKELKELATEVRANHESNNGEFRELSKGFVKLEGLLKSQSDKIDEINNHIDEHIKDSGDKLDKLTVRVDEVEKTVKVNTKDIEELKTDKSNHETRLTSVEKNMIKIAAVVGAVLFLIQLIGSMSSCQEVRSTVRQIFTEEQQAHPTTIISVDQ